MPEDVSHCPLCGGTESRLFDRREFRKQPVINRICSACGLVFQSPRLAESELEGFYENEYRRIYQGEEGPTTGDLAVQEKRASGLLAFVQAQGLFRPESAEKPVLNSAGLAARHLDIGCSSGLLLKRFEAALGTRPVGVEPGTAYREHARQQGLTVYASLHDLYEAQERPFDLVSLIHVLEHLPDPAVHLVQLRETILAANGILLLEVPNLYAHDSFEVAHLVSYSPHTLSQVVQRAGFEILSLRRHGWPRSRLLPLYITLIARPALLHSPHRTFHLRPERGVAVKRRLGMFRRRVIQKLFPGQAWLPK
jgi:2-polyprenyl-3-methyl-5-hydroxy-6-metoxy-1,4-benzoquinol methylase